ncbi:MAG: hypothetical protein EA384_10750 [Spirochaetaceae bacterium]|nr:MAG: hypothetical protein EA384_10750 [Spirochaetaceae bacterium]
MKTTGLRTLAALVLLISAAVPAATDAGRPVSGLRAERDEDAVQLRWQASPAAGYLILFRAREPIVSTERLAAATQIGVVSAAEGGFRDHPIPGVPAYYALVPADAIADGSMVLEQNHNLTTRAVELPLGGRVGSVEFSAPPSFRSSPLPYLQPWRDILEGEGEALPRVLPQQRAARLEPATAEAVERMMQTLPPRRSAARAPTVLAEDGEFAGKGVAFTLAGIVAGAFSHGRWGEAREQLESLLTLPLPPRVEARARFYLGQAFYYKGSHEHAVLEFLLARPHYHAEASQWVAAALRHVEPGSR